MDVLDGGEINIIYYDLLLWTQIVNGVEIGDVNSPLIGLWAAMAVLVNVHAKQKDILSRYCHKADNEIHPFIRSLITWPSIV